MQPVMHVNDEVQKQGKSTSARQSQHGGSVAASQRGADAVSVAVSRKATKAVKLPLSERIQHGAKQLLFLALPPLTWIPQYAKADLPRDVIGGVIMGVMFIPMGLGYAALVGIPLQVGLYSAAIYSLVYGIFGNVGALSMGPVAEISLLLLSESSLPDEPSERAKVVALISFQVGFLALGFCIFKGGVVIRNSFARAVGNAYATAAGIIIIVVQLKDAVNVKGKSTVLLHQGIENIIRGLIDTNLLHAFYCFLCFSVLLGYLTAVKHLPVPSWVPHQLIVVIVAILVTYLAQFNERFNLAIVKGVPSDFPEAGAPKFIQFSDVIVTSVVITLVSFLQMYSIATRVSNNVRANQELFACGLCAFLTGFLGGMPGSSSFSRCLVLEDVKAKTPLNSIVAAIVVFASAAGLTRLGVFYYLPKVALAAIIVSAAVKLVNFDHALWLFKLFKVDFLVWFTVFCLTLFLGVAYGILGGIGLSIIIVLFRVGIPKSYPLAYDPTTQSWIDASTDDELLVHRGVHVWCFDSPLYFVNVSYLTPQLQNSMDRAGRPISVVVIDCTRIRDIDASSVEQATVQLRNTAKRRDVEIVLAGMTEKVSAALKRCPGVPFNGYTCSTVAAAVRYADLVIMNKENLLAPHRTVPAALYTTGRSASYLGSQSVGVIASISHADRSPKQKLKLNINGTPLHTLLAVPRGEKSRTLTLDAQSNETRGLIATLASWPHGSAVERRIARTLSRLFQEQLRGSGAGDMQSFRAIIKSAKDTNVLVVKWGGSITSLGMQQAEGAGRELGSRLGLAGGEFERDVEITVDTNGEDRVLQTAVSFAQAFAEEAGAEVPGNFHVVPELNQASDASKKFDDQCLETVSHALHARTQRDTLLALHVPGVRPLVDVLGSHNARPIEALVHVAHMTATLVAAVRKANRRSPSDNRRAPLIFHNSECASDLARRYALVLAQYIQVEVQGEETDSEGDDDPVTANVPRLAFMIGSAHSFDVTKITAFYDNATYDVIHNARALERYADFDVRALVALLQPLFVAVSSGRFGVTASSKLVASALAGVPLLRRLNDTMLRQVERWKLKCKLEEQRERDDSSATQANASASTPGGPETSGVATAPPILEHAPFGTGDEATAPRNPSTLSQRGVDPTGAFENASTVDSRTFGEDRAAALPIHMYFVPTALVSALRNSMAFSTIMRQAMNPHAVSVLSREETGWHYMTYIVLTITHCPDVGAPENGQSGPTLQGGEAPVSPGDSLRDFCIDVYMSSGAAFRSEAAQRLLEDRLHATGTQSHDAPAGEPVTSATWAAPMDHADPSAATDGERPEGHEDHATHDDAHDRSKKAAHYLTKVAPMLRVWRLTARDFSSVVSEMDEIAERWTEGN
jgi:SulP family sulfate permease